VQALEPFEAITVATIYEVWDTQTANQIGAFGTEAEARSLLADVLRVNGADVAREMVIMAYFPDSASPREPVVVLDGADFVAQRTERVG
jgi:hypothetical protein